MCRKGGGSHDMHNSKYPQSIQVKTVSTKSLLAALKAQAENGSSSSADAETLKAKLNVIPFQRAAYKRGQK